MALNWSLTLTGTCRVKKSDLSIFAQEDIRGEVAEHYKCDTSASSRLVRGSQTNCSTATICGGHPSIVSIPGLDWTQDVF